MSPEQYNGNELTPAADVYSLGVILYEMLVGHVPFTADSPTMVMMKHLQEPVPSVLEERSDLPASIGRVIARAMAKLPANRYQTIAELIEDLTIASGMAQFAPVPGPPPVLNPVAVPAAVRSPIAVSSAMGREIRPARAQPALALSPAAQHPRAHPKATTRDHGHHKGQHGHPAHHPARHAGR